MWNLILKSDTNELMYKTETDLDMKSKVMVTRGETRWGRDKSGPWD